MIGTQRAGVEALFRLRLRELFPRTYVAIILLVLCASAA